MRMSTHIAAYGTEDDVIYEPPHRVLGIDLVAGYCFLKSFDHVDPATGEVQIYPATEPPYAQAIVPPKTLLQVLRLQTSAPHVRTARIPALDEADTFPYAHELLIVSVIDETAHLDVHGADEFLRRPIYPARGTIRVPAADLIQALRAHIEEDQADPPPQTSPDAWES
jgi:hypothetical protein